MIRYTDYTFGTVHVKSFIPESRHDSSRHIVFIHMSWGGAWMFTYFMNYFAKLGHSTYAVDLRGHGESGGTVEGASMQDYVNDVKDAVDALDLPELPIIVGHSMGGLIGLMYAAQHGAKGVVSLAGSPTFEVQNMREEKHYPPSYTPQDAGMPTNAFQAMGALSDIYPWRLSKIKKQFGIESGVARTDRKQGISVPKERLYMPLLFIGASKGASLPFGISSEKIEAQATYYEAPFVEIKGATHIGLTVGKYWKKTAAAIADWLPR